MPGLMDIDDIPAFSKVKNVGLHEVTDSLRTAVTALHEADDIEEFLRAILSDTAATPHGPAEISDILTHRIRLENASGLAAFILKGRSFPTVRPRDVAHQIYRIEKINGLTFAAFGATGIVLDAAKEQFTSTCERLNIKYALLNAEDFARLFWAYGFLCPRDGTRIRGGRCHCGYAAEHAVLNLLQNDALKELHRAHSLAQSKGLIVLPPATGKTRIAARDAKATGATKVLYVAHTNEILDVARSEFEAAFGTKTVIDLSNYDGSQSEFVLISTIQYLEKHLDDISSIEFDYVVIDEFHHAAARTYRKSASQLNARFFLGLTATPFRSDRQDIASLCGHNFIVQRELREGIETGILTPYHYYGCFDDVDYTDLPIASGGYSVRDLERKLIIPERHDAVVAKWKELAEGRPTIAFCCTHKHAEMVARAFSRANVAAETYLSSTNRPDRQALIDRLRTGDLKILCAVDILNEGADIPFVDCLLFLRPTESKRIFVQQLGRGLRRYVGKAHCLVIDFIGNFRNAYRIVEYHGLRPEEFEEGGLIDVRARTIRDILDIPLGCKVTFEERVLSLFADQTLDPRNATRENIGRILIHNYRRLSSHLGRRPTARDVNQYELLGASFYRRVFGSWEKFIKLVEGRL
jgi:superfamily II DNA or RNA helicase